MLATAHPGLLLRELTADQAPVYYALVERNRSHLTAHGDYREMLTASVDSVAVDLRDLDDDDLAFGVWLHEQLIGRVDLVRKDAKNFVLGYWLDSGHTGHGYATFACQVLVEQARLLGGTDAWAGVTKGNLPSERLLTRLGFERVADMGTYTRFHRSLVP
ncbi:MAG TPA: GNAT family N-acetyltransferase [Actinomycetota bacterium]|nr:GNAT family N-acetyltransferase [Actinomycetota bacterium]